MKSCTENKKYEVAKYKIHAAESVERGQFIGTSTCLGKLKHTHQLEILTVLFNSYKPLSKPSRC